MKILIKSKKNPNTSKNNIKLNTIGNLENYPISSKELDVIDKTKNNTT
jgi:hypothetical protein